MQSIVPNSVVDHVCGMKVDPLQSVQHHFEGQTYYFCCQACLDIFCKDPKKFSVPPHLRKKEKAVAGAIYICPMCPEVKSDKPDSCPKCGMALLPLLPTSAEGDDTELRDMRKRFWFSASLTVPLMILSMMEKWPWFQAALCTPVVFWAGSPLIHRAYVSIKTRSFNMFTLIGLGVVVSYFFSWFVLLFPQYLPHETKHHSATEMLPIYFEPAAGIIALVLLGQWLELRAHKSAGQAIAALLDLAPKKALKVEADGHEMELDLDLIEKNDRLKIRAGEKVPVDGVIVEGQSQIDESMVTGESNPIDKKVGDSVVGGTLNGMGVIVIRATRVGSETLLSRIIQMVAEAQRSRARIQKLADQVSEIFVPAVVGVSLLTFIIWTIWGGASALSMGIVNAVAVLIIACPCALGLATPMSIQVGAGRGAKEGILFRNADALEQLSKIDVLLVDKTGTLTEGRPQVVDFELISNIEEKIFWRRVGSLERSSEHVLGRAILEKAKQAKAIFGPVMDVKVLAGFGISGRFENKIIRIGNSDSIRTLGLNSKIDPLESSHRVQTHLKQGATITWVTQEDQLLGWIAISDPIRSSAEKVITQLRTKNIEVVMVTGDHALTASAVASRLNIKDVRAQVKPQDKLGVVKEFQARGKKVAMVGDGVNDAPALAQAQVGIAMGTGTDVAMTTAGIVLLGGELSGLLKARELSFQVMRNIKQNLIFAFAYNSLGVPLAAGIFYPWFGLLLNPMLASAAMSMSSVSVISNALRLRNVNLKLT